MATDEPTTAEMFMAIGLMLAVYAVIVACLCRMRRCRDITVYTQMNMTQRERCAYWCLGRTPDNFDDTRYVDPEDRLRQRHDQLRDSPPTFRVEPATAVPPRDHASPQEPPPYPAADTRPPAYSIARPREEQPPHHASPPPLYEEAVRAEAAEHSAMREQPPPYPELRHATVPGQKDTVRY